MAKLSCFRGTRYAGASGDLSRLISPPYDVISPERRQQLHDLSPHNYVRLVLGQELTGDDDSQNRFTRSRDFIRQWLREGALVRDSEPCLYRQRVRYSVHGQTKELSGLTAAVRLQPYSDGVILRHEKTLQGPKEGLTRLIDATQANLDSVWLMHEDNSGAVREALGALKWEEVGGPATDLQGVVYWLDRCSDRALTEAVLRSFENEQLVIADGHHRYETALAYASSRPPSDQVRPCDFAQATLVWTDDPGLTVLPTHRLVRNLPEDPVRSVAETLGDRYHITGASVQALPDALSSAAEPVFGWSDGKSAFVARPKDGSDTLGAQLVQDDILAGIFGFDVANLKTDPRIAYVEDSSDALSSVADGQFQLAFVLKPIEVRTITRYASQGRCMPQKSTYFYPKLASGLVFREFDAQMDAEPSSA